MSFQILLLIALHILAPIYVIYSVLTRDIKDKAAWAHMVVQAVGLVLFVAIIGRWDWFSLRLRWLPAIGLMAALLVSFQRLAKESIHDFEAQESWWRRAGKWLESGLALALVVFALIGLRQPEQGVDLQFPMSDGDYLVAQGGSTLLTNRHQLSRAQSYAVDLVKLNELGFRADGFYPKELARYEIYNQKVLSPCAGKVLEVEDDLPDLIPPERDQENPAGNYALLNCKGIKLLLAHLQEGSVKVEVDEFVAVGDPIGRVGNSGNTTEPHLHLHAVDESDPIFEGDPILITFNSRFPVRNMQFRR